MLLIRRERYRFFFTFLLILSLFSGLFFRGNVYADETDGGSANVSEGYDAEKKVALPWNSRISERTGKMSG